MLSSGGSAERPVLLIWDKLHGLSSDEDPIKRLMLVEFKKPGRRQYPDRYSPLNQVSRYLNQLKNGDIENIHNRRVRVADDCLYFCYVVADIVGNLEMHTSTWKTTADGRGRWIELGGKFRGTLEVIEWRDLVQDARARNAAYFSFGS